MKVSVVAALKFLVTAMISSVLTSWWGKVPLIVMGLNLVGVGFVDSCFRVIASRFEVVWDEALPGDPFTGVLHFGFMLLGCQ